METLSCPAPRSSHKDNYRLDEGDSSTKFYRDEMERHGVCPRTIGYKSWFEADTVYERAAAGKKLGSVLDVGCGTGGFLRWARAKKVAIGEYLGLDGVSEFVDLCKVAKVPAITVEFAFGTDIIGDWDIVLMVHACDVHVRRRIYTTHQMLKCAITAAPVVVFVGYASDGYKPRHDAFKYEVGFLAEMGRSMCNEFILEVDDKRFWMTLKR